MSPYSFFRSLQMMLAVGFFALIGLGASISILATDVVEIKREISYRQQFGADWQVEYENKFGSLVEARTKAIFLTIGAAAIVATICWLYKLLKKKPHPSSRRHRRRHHKREPESRYARIARFRRNAIIGIYFGLAGIAMGVLLVLFRFGIFREHVNESMLGIGIFIAGYIGVVSGCWWWLKAKGWTEAIVFIAFMPLVVLFIPFVRLLVFAMMGVLAAAMVMAPLTLLVVVLALPDKSGISRKKVSWQKLGRRSEVKDSSPPTSTAKF